MQIHHDSPDTVTKESFTKFLIKHSLVVSLYCVFLVSRGIFTVKCLLLGFVVNVYVLLFPGISVSLMIF